MESKQSVATCGLRIAVLHYCLLVFVALCLLVSLVGLVGWFGWFGWLVGGLIWLASRFGSERRDFPETPLDQRELHPARA